MIWWYIYVWLGDYEKPEMKCDEILHLFRDILWSTWLMSRGAFTCRWESSEVWDVRVGSRTCLLLTESWAFTLFYLLPPASCLHAVWQKAGGDVSFSSAALAGDRVSFGDPAARPHPWKKVLLAGKMAAAVKRSLSTGKSQLHMFISRRVSAEKRRVEIIDSAPSAWQFPPGSGCGEPELIPPLVYFITLLRVFEQHSKRWLVNYAYCILILNFIWFAFPLLLIHAQTSRGSFSAEEELRFHRLQETAIAPKPLNLSN